MPPNCSQLALIVHIIPTVQIKLTVSFKEDYPNHKAKSLPLFHNYSEEGDVF